MIRHTPTNGGWIEVVCGPMYGGKSSELMRRLRLCAIAGKKVVIFKPSIDDRFSTDEIISRDGNRLPAFAVTAAAAIPELAEGYEVIGVDEAQFFDAEIVQVCLELADAGHRVICAGLDMTFRREPFGSMHELLARAEFVDKLQAVCQRCGGPATLTQRLLDGKAAPFAGETIVVGDTESYEARCRGCFEIA